MHKDLIKKRFFYFRNYVNACFAKCKNNIDKDQVEIILKGKLLRAYNDGSIFSKDWSKEPLPRYSFVFFL